MVGMGQDDRAIHIYDHILVARACHKFRHKNVELSRVDMEDL